MKNLKTFKLALLQTKCIPNKQSNIQYIKQALQIAGKNGAKISILGQICNSPYTKQYMIKYAQDFNNSETLKVIKQICLQNKMYAIGTIPRKQNNNNKINKQTQNKNNKDNIQKYYNTAFVINPQGKLQTQYDKLHLFDIDIPNKITYKQSQTFQSGNNICIFDTQYCKIGLGICYDLRFAQLGLLLSQKGAQLLIYPGSFNQTTGPLHWELLLRGRAVDTQCYTVGVSCAQYKQDSKMYQAWGHSTAVDPFGKVLVGLDQNPGIAYCDINLEYLEEVRTMVPVKKQKRNDVYKLDQI